MEGSFAVALSPGTDSDPLDVKTADCIDARQNQEYNFWLRWQTVGILLVSLFHRRFNFIVFNKIIHLLHLTLCHGRVGR